ncbi:hypothetical protein [Natronosalvus rutilus]|uniref:Uncharacterized protein n=1 Tax=Natronosalvus rutilus TaxID=2953753 RepID=A0A9E7N5X1_9EURY|nr:hypothetical protein [Natronosalvus rutilus]UTF52140.1 hypothetical protein NGM29_10030 [Natronosalvus rutilus]
MGGERDENDGVAGSRFGTVYLGSDGRFYTSWDVLEKYRSGTWKPCLRHRSGRRLVADGDALLSLTPVAASDLPDWLEIRVTTGQRRVKTRAIDTRQ